MPLVFEEILIEVIQVFQDVRYSPKQRNRKIVKLIATLLGRWLAAMYICACKNDNK
jgi:hypothetical protein